MRQSRDTRAPRPLNRAGSLIIAAVVLLALTLRVYTLSKRPLWDDEAWTLFFVYLDNPWRIITVSLNRFHPPIVVFSFYLIEWIAVHLFATTPALLRVPAVLFGVLGVAATYYAGALLFAPETGLIAAALSAVNVLQIARSQEMREYSLVLLLSWASICLLVRAVRSGHSAEWVLYGAVTLLLIYVHDYTVFVLAAQALYVIVSLPRRDAARLTLRLAAFWALAYAPAVVVVVHSVRTGRPITSLSIYQEANLRNLLLTYAHLTVTNGSSIVFLACVLPIILLGALRLVAKPPLRGAFMAAGFLAVSPFLAWCLSPPIPFGVEKYFIFASPALLLLVGQGLLEIRPSAVRSLVIGSLLALSLPALSHHYNETTYPPYDQAAEYIKSVDPGLPLVLVGDGLRVFNYYYAGGLPRLGSPEWTSLAARTPRRTISFDRTAKDPFRPSACDNMHCERIAPGLFWTGTSLADTVSQLDPSIAESFWLVAEQNDPAPNQEVRDPRCRLVIEKDFGPVHVRRYALVR